MGDKLQGKGKSAEFGILAEKGQAGARMTSNMDANLAKCPRGKNIALILKEKPELHKKRLKHLREKMKGNSYHLLHGFDSRKTAKNKLRQKLWNSFPDIVPRQHKANNPLLEETYRMLREHFCNSRLAEMQDLAITEVSKYQSRYTQFLNKYFDSCKQCDDAMVDEGDQKRIEVAEQHRLLDIKLKERGIPQEKIAEFGKYLVQTEREGKTFEEALSVVPDSLKDIANLICE